MDATRTETKIKSKYALKKDVKKMLDEHKLEAATPHVVTKLSAAAENMAVELLKNAAFYANKTDGKTPLTKEDIQLAIQMRDLQEQGVPDKSEIANEAAAINSKPLQCKSSFGIPLPKEHLGNCNYQLMNPEKKMKQAQMGRPQAQEVAGPSYKFLVPFKNYKEASAMNLNSFVAKQMADNPDLPLKITITPAYGPHPSQPGGSMHKKN